MPYKYGEYTLHNRETILKSNNKKYNLYFFAKSIPKSGTPCEMPEGWQVIINEKTGCPFLKYSDDRLSGWQKTGKQAKKMRIPRKNKK